MADKLMHNPNDDTKNTPSSDNNYWLKCLNTKINETTNQNSLKFPKLLSQRISKRYIKLWRLVLLTIHCPSSICKITLWQEYMKNLSFFSR